jgi:hypothetical protein
VIGFVSDAHRTNTITEGLQDHKTVGIPGQRSGCTPARLDAVAEPVLASPAVQELDPHPARPPMFSRRRVVRACSALAVHLALVVWLTWPLAKNIDASLPYTSVACLVDPPYMAWALAYESHTLVTAPSRLADANIYHPARNALFYGDTGFSALPYFMPTFLVTGNPALALNLVLLGCLALSAWALHLVVLRWTGSYLGGLLAGFTLLATRWTLWEFIPCAPSYSVLQYFPLIMLLASRPAHRFRDALRLLPWVVLQCLTDVVYVAAAVVAPLGLLALGRLVRRETRGPGLRLLAVLGLTLLALLPVYAGHAAVSRANPDLRQQSVWALDMPLPGINLPWGPFMNGPVAIPVVALLLIGIGLACFVLRTRRASDDSLRTAWAHASLWAIGGLFFSLGPGVTFNGRPIWLPQFALTRLYAVIRVPPRLGVASLMGLAVLTGLAFAECVRWFPERGLGARLARLAFAAVVAAGMYSNYAAGSMLDRGPVESSYPLEPAPASTALLAEIKRQPDGPLLELPASARTMHVLENVRAMYRSLFHWRPILNGYSSYFPTGFPERMALAAQLPDPIALARLRQETGLTLVLVHTKSPEEVTTWLSHPARGARAHLQLVASHGRDFLFYVSGPTEPPALP